MKKLVSKGVRGLGSLGSVVSRFIGRKNQKGGEKEMRNKLICLLVGLGLVGGLVSYSFAANPDSCEVSCTPLVTYSVQITTPAAGFAFGNVNVSQQLVHSSTAVVKNNGGVTADWKIKGVQLNNWSLGTAPGLNQVRLLGVLKTSIASSADFNVSLDTITVTEANMDATNYSVDQNGNDVAVNEVKYLSIRLDTPTDTSYTTEQKFRIEIKAYVSSTF